MFLPSENKNIKISKKKKWKKKHSKKTFKGWSWKKKAKYFCEKNLEKKNNFLGKKQFFRNIVFSLFSQGEGGGGGELFGKFGYTRNKRGNHWEGEMFENGYSWYWFEYKKRI